ncbi:MAG: hypothetical protein AB8B55_24100 [Mariniblastus sp.]
MAIGSVSPSASRGQVQFRTPTVPANETIGGRLVSSRSYPQDAEPSTLGSIVQKEQATAPATEKGEYQFGKLAEAPTTLVESGGVLPSQGGLEIPQSQIQSQQFPNQFQQDPVDIGGGFLPPRNSRDGQLPLSHYASGYANQDDAPQRDGALSIPLINEYDNGGGGLGIQGNGMKGLGGYGETDLQDTEELPPELNSLENQSSGGTGEREIVIENYADGKPKIIREMIQDAEGNYFNDGKWLVKSPGGDTVAAGIYKKNVMQGTWFREHTAESGGLFATKPFNLFQGPFYSVANFKDGKLDGMWTISDQYRRKIFEVPYKNGHRHGKAIWWYPNDARMRQATFKNGVIDGEVIDWDEGERKVRVDRYVDGRKIILNTTFYRGKIKNTQEYFLDAKLEPDDEDNWWDAQPTPYLPTGTRVQDGPSMSWYENGQPKKRGQYDEDQPVGQFVWWHPNGNKQIVGMYSKGMKNGRWTWWFANGMKQYEGQYKDDQPTGVWRSWSKTGRLIKKENFSQRAEEPQESTDENTNTDGSNAGNSQPNDPDSVSDAPGKKESAVPDNAADEPAATESESGQTSDEINGRDSVDTQNLEELPDPQPQDFGTPEESETTKDAVPPTETEEEIGGLPTGPLENGTPD